METLLRFIASMSDDLAKLHHLEKYAAFGLESQSFEIMQETWNA
jgi:hypothetical protein